LANAPAASAAPVFEAWFEFYRTSLRDALKAGLTRPERIFSSEDPRWAEIEALSAKNPIYGNLIVGTVKRDGENFTEGSLKVRDHYTSQRFDKAREKMRLFETDGRWGTTQYADAMREAEDAKKQGIELNQRLTVAMETLASNLSNQRGASK